MDNQNYLNEISNTTPSFPSQSQSLFPKKFLYILLAAFAALIFIIILGSILSSGSGRDDALDRIHLRSSYLSEAVSPYQSSIKSTSLRASSTTLLDILSRLSRETAIDIPADSEVSPFSPSLERSEVEHAVALDNTLSHAVLIGSLDRIFASQISLELNLLLSLISSYYSETADDTLRASLSENYSSLATLLPAFENFSPTY